MTGESRRLDIAISDTYPNLSRSLIQKLISHGFVHVNGVVAKKNGHMVTSKDTILVNTEALQKPDDVPDLQVLYEDEDCAVIDKPAGVLVHSKGAYNPEPTVLTWLQNTEHYAFGKDDERGGIVHRLDRATSGVMICAKNKKALGYLQKQFQNRTTKKEYVARVKGVPNLSSAKIDIPLERNPKKPQTFRPGHNGKDAQTEYTTTKDFGNSALVTLRPRTGRTHQLRVHMYHIGHPIYGDVLYAGPAADRLYLHASSLEITLPHGLRRVFESPLPKSFLSENIPKS